MLPVYMSVMLLSVEGCLRTMRKKRLAALSTLKPFKSMTYTSGDVAHGIENHLARAGVDSMPEFQCPDSSVSSANLEEKLPLTDMKVISLKVRSRSSRGRARSIVRY